MFKLIPRKWLFWILLVIWGPYVAIPLIQRVIQILGPLLTFLAAAVLAILLFRLGRWAWRRYM